MEHLINVELFRCRLVVRNRVFCPVVKESLWQRSRASSHGDSWLCTWCR
jgi:hypothetical protein